MLNAFIASTARRVEVEAARKHIVSLYIIADDDASGGKEQQRGRRLEKHQEMMTVHQQQRGRRLEKHQVMMTVHELLLGWPHFLITRCDNAA